MSNNPVNTKQTGRRIISAANMLCVHYTYRNQRNGQRRQRLCSFRTYTRDAQQLWASGYCARDIKIHNNDINAAVHSEEQPSELHTQRQRGPYDSGCCTRTRKNRPSTAERFWVHTWVSACCQEYITQRKHGSTCVRHPQHNTPDMKSVRRRLDLPILDKERAHQHPPPNQKLTIGFVTGCFLR